MNYNYTYTLAGNIIQKNTEHGNYSYGYDDLYRLTNADYPTLIDETFTYDSLGNRKTDSNTGVTEWLYNQNNQLLNSVNNQYTYDANGSQIEEKGADGQVLKQYIYNTENRLTVVKDVNGKTIATYYYDPFGRRLSKIITNPNFSTTTTYFHYNDEGYSAEKNNGLIISYLFSPQNTWSSNPILKRKNNIYFYYQNDHLGTPNILHDKLGQVVNARETKAFGEWVTSTNVISDNFAFAGQYRDLETSKYYNFHRDYYPNLGRYIESDPIGLKGGINVYIYALSSPILLYDFNGLMCSCIALKKNKDYNEEWLFILNKRYVNCDYKCTNDDNSENVNGNHVEIHFWDPENDSGTEGNCIGQLYKEFYNTYSLKFTQQQIGYKPFDPRDSDSDELQKWGEENCKCSN